MKNERQSTSFGLESGTESQISDANNWRTSTKRHQVLGRFDTLVPRELTILNEYYID